MGKRSVGALEQPRRRTSRRRRPPAARVGLDQALGEPLGVGVDCRIGPSSSASARFSSLEAIAITRPAPSGWPSCTASEPTPPAAEWTTTLSPCGDAPGPIEVPGGGALHDQRERRAVVDAIGDREDELRRGARVLRVAALTGQRDDPLAGVLADARHLPAGDERQRGLLHVGVGAGVRVGEVQPRARDLDQHLAGAGLGLRAARPARAPPARRTRSSGSHAWRRGYRSAPVPAPRALRCPPMPITVVGSIAYDAVKTPFGERERMLGGAAVHFALAASFFDEVRVVGPVGDDFGEEQLEVMRRARRGRHRTSSASPAARPSSGSGEYGWDLNSRETLDTQLGVFEGFAAEALGALARERRAVPRQHPARSAARGARAAARRALRGARLDEPVDRHRARLAGQAIESVDCLILNDAELRQLTGKPNLVSAAREILGGGPPSGRAARA